MELRSLFHLCVYFCLIMLIFTMCINLVGGMDIWDVSYDPGTRNTNFTNLTNVTYTDPSTGTASTGMDALWKIAVAGGGAALIVGFLTRSPVFIGVAAFAGVFWSSYINTISIITQGIDLLSPAGGFIAIGTAAMGFVFAGALAGMLSGSG